MPAVDFTDRIGALIFGGRTGGANVEDLIIATRNNRVLISTAKTLDPQGKILRNFTPSSVPGAARIRDITVDPETYEVTADGELLTCAPAEVLPMAQRYFLF